MESENEVWKKVWVAFLEQEDKKMLYGEAPEEFPFAMPIGLRRPKEKTDSEMGRPMAIGIIGHDGHYTSLGSASVVDLPMPELKHKTDWDALHKPITHSFTGVIEITKESELKLKAFIRKITPHVYVNHQRIARNFRKYGR